MDLAGLFSQLPFSGTFEDDNGGGSSTRLVFVAGALTIIGVWAWLSVKANMMIPVTAKDLGILLVLILGKLGGKALEVKENIAHKEPNGPT